MMDSINLDSLSLTELKTLQKDVSRAISEFSSRRKTEAILALDAHARELGFSLVELTGLKKTRKSSGPAGAKYRHPENPEMTWSGRGRQPGWFKEALGAGRSATSMVI